MTASDISVIIPCTRPVTCIENLVPSLLHNDILPKEIIVVSKIVGKLASHSHCPVRVIHYNSHVYNIDYRDVVLKRNIGAHVANGTFLLFQDDDQVAPAGLVSSFREKLCHSPYVLGNHRFIDFTAQSWRDLMRMGPEAGQSREEPPNGVHGWQSCYAGCLGIRKQVFDESGGFDMLFMGLHAGEDQELGYRLVRKYGKENNIVHEPPFSWHPLRKQGEQPVQTSFHNTCTIHYAPCSGFSEGRVREVTRNGFRICHCMDCTYMRIHETEKKRIRTKGQVIVPFIPGDVRIYEL